MGELGLLLLSAAVSLWQNLREEEVSVSPLCCAKGNNEAYGQNQSPNEATSASSIPMHCAWNARGQPSQHTSEPDSSQNVHTSSWPSSRSSGASVAALRLFPVEVALFALFFDGAIIASVVTR